MPPKKTRGHKKPTAFSSTRGGRGRGGRNRRAFLPRGGATGTSTNADVDMNAEKCDETLDINKDIKKFFVGVASFDQHREAQENHTSRYAAGLALLHRSGVELSQNAKVRALAAAWSRKDQNLAKGLLSIRDLFGFVEVLKAVTILDSARHLRQMEKRLNSLTTKSDGKVKKRTLSKYKVKIDNLTKIKPSHGSVSGALCRQLKKWAATFSKSELEYFALQMPTEPWRKLADIVHFNPSDFVNLPWFLRLCYGDAAPQDSAVYTRQQITKDNINELVSTKALPFSVIRSQGVEETSLNFESRATVVRNEDKIDRGIWWYEELQCPQVDDAIMERLESGEEITLNYGKLMERLVTFKKLKDRPKFYDRLLKEAEGKLENTKLALDTPIAVLADASSSMSVAIETATIVSSLLAASGGAELLFFNNECWRPSCSPTTIADVIDLALTTKACKSTSPAAALWPFYESKKVIKTFIVVTDEEENTQCHGDYFNTMFKKYQTEVYDAELIFISFLRSQTSPGDMVPKLRNNNARVKQFCLGRGRPDLTKLDNILGRLTASTESFEEELKQVEAQIENVGIKEAFIQMFGQTNLVPV